MKNIGFGPRFGGHIVFFLIFFPVAFMHRTLMVIYYYVMIESYYSYKAIICVYFTNTCIYTLVYDEHYW